MKVLFLNPQFGATHPEGLDAPMGIMYLGAVLGQQGHRCSLVDHTWEEPDDWSSWRAAVATRPDVALINTQIRFGDTTGRAVEVLRSMDASPPVLAFGPQASTEVPRLLEMGFDGCVVGEPEEVVPGALAALGGGRGLVRSDRGLATRAQPTVELAPRVDVEQLPFPDWELADYGRYIRATHNAVFMASRGSDTEDAFNQPPLIHASRPTRRCSVERVMAELGALRQRFRGRYMLLFHDEVFTEDRGWVMALCTALQERRPGVPLWCFTRPDLLDRELCRVMRRAGFVGVSMGMESGSNRVLELLEKGLTGAQIRRGFRDAQRAGLLTAGSVMIGTPGTGGAQDERREELEDTVRMVARVHPDVLTITITTPLPGTRLAEKIVETRVLVTEPAGYNFYDVYPGKYPLRLDGLSPTDLDQFVARIRGAWKRGLWKTAGRTALLGVRDSAFRSTMVAQIVKVVRRKLLRTR